MDIEKLPRPTVAGVRPQLVTDTILAAAFETRPSLMMDVQPRFLQYAGAANAPTAFRALNLTDDSLLAPASANRPVALGGGALGLRFGADIGLVSEGNPSLDLTGDYTVSWVGRVPPGGGGPVVGRRTDTAQSWIGILPGTDVDTGVVYLRHQGNFAAGFYGNRFDDNAWHRFCVAYRASDKRVAFYIDGGDMGSALANADGGWGSAQPVMIGALGASAPTAYLTGDVAAVAIHAGQDLGALAAAPARAAINAWLAAVANRVGG